MSCVWVHGCDPGRVWDGSRLAIDLPFLVFMLSLYCGFVDVPLIFSRPYRIGNHLVILDMVETRSINNCEKHDNNNNNKEKYENAF